MSYFLKSYKEHIKQDKALAQLIDDFDYMLDNMWCTYSFDKGKKKWLELSGQIDLPYSSKISNEVGHVELGHGRKQALMALRDEMSAYIDNLLYIRAIDSEIAVVEDRLHKIYGLDKKKVEEIYKTITSRVEKLINDEIENLAELSDHPIWREGMK